MNDIQQIKNQFIESSTLNSKASAKGDYKTANKHAKILKNILKKMENGTADKKILVELLDDNYVGVRVLAAIDLLRINYEIDRAEKTLEKIISMDETNLRTDEKLKIFAAQLQLKSWKEKGYVSR